ncbi:ZmpA/ZmpB/ZmpC family metallo-endopeptidase [Streptococcus pneumoniae]|uniref:ZmpA/ZmpB/ZmpC family metallo-endopeptidase n=1 Tax=Streptococcus pneumoniae TaxID=1313 RepID=UPI0010AE0B84|nr:ZmpA/ZmpB/ZmpC family metallo-endopeptidase [Streptococcus pneumoniae]TKC99162.1 YSIRK-type signal peptide-containing protein [Streptococcus pneumoniae]HEU3290775.1 G5 domain-containing protein [Streptococcus pneumoniae]HEU3593915.1 G5 domain-containing protein [Streptococcus pneumoniae]HEU9862230.1 G5 domain-containing protein [Streptococcus pneumoniae]HEU9881318.1 G5 domain-containing protein [Streptococcus pneumoniae]
MEKYFGEKQERFSFRKLSVGLVSATISSLFFMSVLASSSVDAQETAGVHYKYVADSELSSEEKKQLVYDIPTYVENDDETYYLVYKLNSQNQLAELPNTGSKNERQALVAGASLAALGILIFAVSKKKVKNKTVLHLVLVAGIGNGVLVSVHALENHLLLNYNTDYELTSGEKLPLPKEISGYTYIGYIKEGKTTSDFEVSNQEKSAATPTKQQKVDYNVTPNFVDHPSTVQAIQEQTPVSSTKPTEVQVVEKPFSTELINPRKEEKQSSDSQEQLAEHKNLETKKEEKISPKEKTGVNTLNPQDEVLSGQLNKPELLYREETIETKIDFQEEIQENPDLAEGTVRVKQEGKLGKKVEIVRIFSVNKEEVSREIVSTSTTAPSPRIVEKGTKKTQVIKEQPETGVEHKDVQSGAIVEPAIQPELPEAVVSDKGEPEVQPALSKAVITDKGETEVQPESPDTVVSDKGEPEQVAPLPEYTGPQASAIVEPEQVAPLPEYTGVQAGAIVEPAVQPALPEAVVSDKGVPEVQPELPEAVVSDKGVPEVQPELPEAVVSDKGEPEQVAPLPEYKGNIEQVKPETPVEKTKEQGPEKTEEVPVKPTEETPVNPNEGTTEGTSIQEAENPVQPAEESTTNSEKVSPDTSSENTGEVSSNPSDSTTSVGESNKPEHNDSKNENSEKTVEEVPVNPNEGTTEGTSIQEAENPVQPAEETQTNSGKIANENTGEVSNKPSDSKPPVEESNQPEKNGTATKPENSGNTTSENGQTEPEKKLELRNVSDIELYSQTNGTYRQHVSLDGIPENTDTYFVKVKSSAFKDVYIPVASITEEKRNGQSVYKITAKAEKLQQELENKYTNNFTFYLDKKKTEEKTNFTSFSNLVNAINQNLAGTYHLAASLNANEVELGTDDKSYIKGTFTGQLIGEKDGKHYAIYNLKKPLFESLRGATIEKLSLKNVAISGKDDIGSLANEAQNNTKIKQVHVDGVLAGERGIGGLVAKVDQSNITNSSFTGRIVNTYETKSAYNIGGLVGHLTGDRASINSSKSTVVISSNTNSSDQTVGGIAGLVDKDAHIQNSYSEGDINNSQRFGKVAGIAGNLWDRESNSENHAGRLTNVLSDVNVTNGNAISGYHYNGMKITDAFSNKANKVFNVTLEKDEVVSKESFEERGTMLDASQIASKKAEINLLTPPIVEPLSTSGKKDSDFSKIAHYQANRALVYKNIEKLLPFYNKATIVKYGNLVKENSILYQKELLSAVMMKDDQVITDIISNKQTANKLLLHYKDHSSEKFDLRYQDDFANLAEYSIGDSGLLYTPNQFLYDQDSIINQVLPELQQVAYDSEAIRKTLGISPEVKQTELYMEDQFTKTKQDLANSLKKLLSADAGLAGDNPVTRGYLVDKIKNNKEALLLGLTYLERWYNFSYGQVNVKDLVMYHPDFFGKGNTSPLDTLIELGKSGFNNLLAKNNVDTYAISLASHHGTTDLFSTLENYRKVFLPDKTNNNWFKSQTKAYIVEEKSNIEEVKTKQGLVGTKYSIGVYDRITSATWKYRNMVLPLLTLPEKSVFVISTISSLGFGAYDRYRNSEHKAGKDLNDFVEENARETAKRQRDHYDYWYRILDEQSREKLYRTILLYDAYKFGDDTTSGKATAEAKFDSSNPAMKNFFGPVGNKVVHNQHGAYATGDGVYYMSYRMLDKDGAITYTHEMTHDSDQDIYLGGYGRRNGLGPEFFAKGLLQAPDQPSDATITINSILKHSKSDSTEGSRLQVLDPTERFQNAADLQNYVHNMFDLIYMMEYLEGQSIVNKLSVYQKMAALRKIENKYVKDPADGNEVYATNVVKELTEAEARNLNSFESLIDHNILSAREYQSGDYERNGYYTIKLFAPIYSALSSEKGTPGDLMGRRIAYELLAAKGFKDGMVPYISNQYEEDAKQQGQTINLYGKERGLVTDELVLKKVFDGKYKTWAEFKTAMYQERVDQFGNLKQVTFKDPTKPWPSYGTKTINNVDELQALMDQAVLKDAEGPRWSNYDPEIDSAVHKLKRAIFKAYLDQTNDFRSSIFENKK